MIKPGARLEGAWVEEARNSQRLFLISKELQLNTKFHYMEVQPPQIITKSPFASQKLQLSENRSSHRPTPCQGKKPQEREKEREEERVRKRRGEGERGREGKRERERREGRRKKKRRKRY